MADRFLRKDYHVLLAKIEELAGDLREAGQQKGFLGAPERGSLARQLRL